MKKAKIIKLRKKWDKKIIKLGKKLSKDLDIPLEQASIEAADKLIEFMIKTYKDENQ